MALLTVQNIVKTGLVVTYAAASAQDTVVIDGEGRHFVQVKNASVSAINCTINVVNSSARVPGVGTLTVADYVVSIPANTGDKLIGPIPPAYMTASGLVTIDFSASTSVTVAVLKLPKVLS